MKTILTIFCWILAIYAVWFPISYFGKYYDKMEVRLSHILVKTENEAVKIKQEITEGKDFNEMAEKYSMDKLSDKGDIGYSQRYRYTPEIDYAAFHLGKNEVSTPIESKHGWHLIKVTDIRYYSDSENFKYNPYRYVNML